MGGAGGKALFEDLIIWNSEISTGKRIYWKSKIDLNGNMSMVGGGSLYINLDCQWSAERLLSGELPIWGSSKKTNKWENKQRLFPTSGRKSI